MIKLDEVFSIHMGNKLDLNKMTISSDGVNFVSRTSKRNGVVQRVKRVDGITPFGEGVITVALGGSVLSSFLQFEEFYTGQNVAILIPKREMPIVEKLFYCLLISSNAFRYSACGREANKTLKGIYVLEPKDFPSWIYPLYEKYQTIYKTTPLRSVEMPLCDVNDWREFKYCDLFTIVRGKGPRKKELDGTGTTPLITSSNADNGLTDYTCMAPCHDGNTITVSRNGSVGEAFYQISPFCSTEDVHVLIPKFQLDSYIAMFIITLIKKEKFRFGYGRKWGLERMNNSVIRLPVLSSGELDLEYMRNFIKGLPFSSTL